MLFLSGKISALIIILVFAAQSLGAKKIEFKIQEGRKLVAIIDAGSSGSRLYIYEYNDYNDDPIKKQNRVMEIINHKVDPGISSFGENLDALDLYFTKLIDGSKNKLINYNKTHQTKLSLEAIPVYLLATAGMRNLNQNIRNNIFAKIKDILKKSVFKFQEARTINGLEEGVFAWVAANFNQPSSELLGIVEIGGASTQVVFPYKGKNPHAITLSLDDKDYNLYAYSYAKKGENESADRIKNLDNKKFEALCSTMTHTKRKSSTFNACVDLIIKSFQSECDIKRACQNGWSNDALQPPVDSNLFFTFAGIIGATKNIIKSQKNPMPFDQKSLQKAGSFACQMTTHEISAKDPKNHKYAHKACFQSALSYAILYGNKDIQNNQELYNGVGLSVHNELIEIPAPGPEWSIGFILFHEANGYFKK